MDYKIYNDYELIYMVRENDDVSYDILLKKYLPIIKNIASEYYTKFKNFGYELDDFVQEGYIGFQKAIVNYNENKDSLFYSFVSLCIRRNILTFCRKISSMKRNFSSDFILPIEDFEIKDQSTSIDSIVDSLFINELVKKMLLKLSLKDSSIFELKFNDFSYSEISILLNIPKTTVEYRVRKVKNLLKSDLENYFSKKTD